MRPAGRALVTALWEGKGALILREAIIEVVKQQMRDSNAGGEEDGANRGSGASDVMNDALDKLLIFG